jgi:hypothetical protein
MGDQGVLTALFMGRPRGLRVRAKARREAAQPGRTRARVRPSQREEEDPDRWGPPVNGRERLRGRPGKGAGSAWAERVGLREREKKGERRGRFRLNPKGERGRKEKKISKFI